eukprot:Awhi_evm2s976
MNHQGDSDDDEASLIAKKGDQNEATTPKNEEPIVMYSHPKTRNYTNNGLRSKLFGLNSWILVNFDSLPHWLKDNEHILDFHRPELTNWS